MKEQIMQTPEPETATTDTKWEILAPTALESLERANIDLQISTAKRYPRSLAVVKKRMLDLATLDQETAESCFYKLNRNGRSIEGPSIRLAEIAGSSFGNLRYGARVIDNDGKQITAQAYCFDLETNVMCQIEVKRRITDRFGKTYSDDMQVVTGNAACAIAARNAVFKVVPFAFVKPIFEAAKKVAVGSVKTLAERRTKMLNQFSAMGVTEKQICGNLNKQGIEEIGLQDLETLIGLYTSIKDGEQTIDEAFPVVIARANIPKPKDKDLSNGMSTAVVESQSTSASVGQGGNPDTQREDKTPAQKLSPKLQRKKKEPKLWANSLQLSEALTPANQKELVSRLTKEGFTTEQFMAVMIGNDWCPADASWPLEESVIGDVLESESWRVVLEALKG